MVAQEVKQRIESNLLFTSFQYYCIPLLYLITFISIKYYSNPWTGLWILYALIPLIDQWLIIDNRNPSLQETKKLIEDDWIYKFPIYLSCFADWALMFWVLNYLTHTNLSAINNFATILIAGNMASNNFNIAHELFHKDNQIDKMLGTLTMARNLYMHFAIEHIFGHHRHVATPIDPTSAHQGETLPAFVKRSVKGSYLSALKYEGQRVQKIYKTKSPYNIHNRMIWFTASYFLIPLVICSIYGLLGAFYFLLIAIISIFQLEAINYIEHYGLKRKEISQGVYEPVSILHSWNAPHRLSNYLLFKLQRHSDHHENSYKPYQTLCTYDESPCLPNGYSVCLMLALNQPLWFDVMDRQLLSWEKQDSKLVEVNQKKVINYVYKMATILTIVHFLTFFI